MTFGEIFRLILPVFALIAVGVALRRYHWVEGPAESSLLRLVVYVCMPCLVFDTIIGNASLRNPSNLLLPPLAGFGLTVTGLGVAYLAGRAVGLAKGTGLRTFALSAGSVVVRTTGAQDLQSAGDALLRSVGTVTLQGENLVLYPQTGTCVVQTTVPNAISLGAGATSHAALHEPLVAVLTTIFNAINELRTALATLALPVNLTPPVGPVATASPALIAQFTPAINPDLTPIQATTTRIL